MGNLSGAKNLTESRPKPSPGVRFMFVVEGINALTRYSCKLRYCNLGILSFMGDVFM